MEISRTETPRPGHAGEELSFLCVLPEDDWHIYTRRHHLGALAEHGPLLAVERPLGLKRSLLADRSGRRLRPAGAGHAHGAWLIQPSSLRLPIAGARGRSVRGQIQRALRTLGMERPVAVLTSPAQRWFFDLDIETSGVCFELSDEFSLYTQYPFIRSTEMYDKIVDMVRRSDVVFATARSLAEEFAAVRGNTYWVPNTAEPEDFCVTPHTAVLPELRDLSRPVIGFIGGLNPWIDVELLLGIQELRPDWSIVFSASLDGPPAFLESEPVRRFQRENRIVRFLGWVPYPRLRNFLRGVDVCALFHRVSEVTRFIHPNKIYQYLASGKPIVSTPFLPEIEEFGSSIRLATTPKEFVEAVERGLEEGPHEGQERVRIASERSPVRRAARKVAIIRDRVLGPGAGNRARSGAQAGSIDAAKPDPSASRTVSD